MHPLLEKIAIDSCNLTDLSSNKDLIFNKIVELGLQAKKHGDLIIVKYGKELKRSTDNFIRCSRGVIIDTNTKKIVNYSFDGDVDLDTFKNNVSWDNLVIEPVLDGSMLNLYYHNNKWNISTKFCTNAYESKFRSNKSFGCLLDDVIDISKLNLDTSFSYSILLQHTENRIVTPITENKVFYLESVNLLTSD